MTSRDRRPATAAGFLLAALAASPALAAPAVPEPAAAPDPATPAAAGADDALGVVVVTAQKRETNLQRTPIAIAVLNDRALADRHILSLADLGDGSVPGLRVAPFFSRKSALTIGIRGVGTLGDANQPAREQGVGVYLDGVYLGRAQGLGAALFDVERIEVLKGPQGTLFGRNTEGGALSIVTRKPSGKFAMRTTAGVANYGGYEAITHIDLPESNHVSFKLDALLERRGGTIDNPLDGQGDLNSYDRRGLAVSALWEPSASFSALYRFDIARDATTPYYLQLLAPGSLPLAPILPLQPDRAKAASVGVPLQDSVGDTKGASLHLDARLGDGLRARSITSFRRLTQSQFDNGSTVLSVYAPNATFSRYSQAFFAQRQFSQELQLIADTTRLNLVGGLFYYHEQVRDNAFTPNTLRFNATGTGYTVLSPPIAAFPFPDRASRARTDSTAAFGQATWTPPVLADALHVTAGGRYSHDRKTGALFRVNGALPTVAGVTGEVPLRTSSNRFDPLVSIALDASPDLHFYGRWSTGYKSAGANSRSLTYRPFGPESVSEYEVGAKTEFLDDRVRLNLAAYTGTYKDVQIDFNAVIPGANRGTLETTNTAGSGRIKGAEADLTIAPVAGLTLSASYAYNYVRLPAAPNPFVAGNPLVVVYPVYAPRHAASGAIDFRQPLGAATFVAHLDANYAGPQYTNTTDPTRSDAGFLVNGRLAVADIALNDGGARLEVSAWSRNLFNRSYAFVRNRSAALGTYGIFNEPRTYGLDVSVRF